MGGEGVGYCAAKFVLDCFLFSWVSKYFSQSFCHFLSSWDMVLRLVLGVVVEDMGRSCSYFQPKPHKHS